ncbi:capsid assembly protein [Enterobacter sp. CGMCC 5087]|uniref:head completion/stabilization protein n=1 Tax=Enterobacter sp. CGMCC 5087 TaxID=2183878 RepID=UPI000D6837CB|nr:head completion/stabilization protein [Enterobacter sp. CGMCC 5087]PWI80498.1 capsid assembly protein [Enterobacter sp. CGMCC 5087]
MGSLNSINTALPELVTNSDFWPDIELNMLRLSVRLDGNVTNDRLRHVTIEAINRVNDELADWRDIQRQSGYTTLAGVPAEKVGGVSVLTSRYLRAVYSTTKALIIESYRDIDTTREGEKHAEALATQIEDTWRDSQWALRDILGLNRGLAEIA